jgi:VIT1/CCC1 family predicted Fe2+/Mn2+ transporter
VSRASTGLCGGCRVTDIPTATSRLSRRPLCSLREVRLSKKQHPFQCSSAEPPRKAAAAKIGCPTSECYSSAMPISHHIERHFEATATVRDVVIGMADGLTVPFALAAGLSGAVDASNIIVVAGLAEIAAGSIAMGLGGYLAARTDVEHYISELKREWRETKEMPEEEADEVAGMFRKFEMSDTQIAPVVDAIRADRKRWVDFMMRFELGLERPDPKRARRSAATIAGSYIAGGFIRT